MTMPRFMKAAILVEQKKPLIIDEVQLPDALELGQVLVKVHFSGICGSQLGEIDGIKGADQFLPHLLGHEASGTVIEIGLGVKHVKKGDVVVMHWRKGSGIEASPPSYIWHGKKLNAGWVSTFNEYAIVSENRVTTIASNSDLMVAALFGCAVTTGFGVIENNAKVRIGESVVVFGSGGVGLNMIQAASLVGAHPIIAVDLYENRLSLAKELGATHLINARQSDPKAGIEVIAKSFGGVDVFIDNTGQTNNIELGYQLVKKEGRVVLVGVPSRESNIKIHSLPMHFGKLISGSHGGETNPEKDIPRYYLMHTAKKIELSKLITKVDKLENINDLILQMRNGELTGRCMVQM
jgi:S-(hydroxymethyl)glutathione dehydrogenase/alcohol dehydrogenase